MCECKEPGFCPLHNIVKNKALFEHCQKGDVIRVDGRIIEPPTFLKRIANFTVSKISHVISGSPEVSKEILNQRVNICQECPFFNFENRECDKCGCPIDEKCKWATEKCPDSPPRWISISNSGGCNSCNKK